MFNAWKKQLDFVLPNRYEEFLDSLKEEEVIDFYDDFGNGAYFYGYTALMERNETYEVSKYVPDYFMIGQDGDLGLFIHKQWGDDIYALDLGALGSMEMHYVARNIADCITMILCNEDENWQLVDLD